MSSVSKSQQRLFGAVHNCQKTGNCPPYVAKIAGSISEKDAEDFASTKHKGLPERKKMKSFKEWEIEESLNVQSRNIAQQFQSDPDVQALGRKVGITNYVRKLGILLNSIEQKLGNQQSGEEAHNWHEDATKILYEALKMAVAGGKVTWNQASQLNNIKNNVTQQPQQQNPTPLNQL